jgi:hypothetical protein
MIIQQPSLDVLEGLERLVQVADELGQFVSSGLADVAFVDYEHDLDLLVDVEQSLGRRRSLEISYSSPLLSLKPGQS